MFAQDDLIIAIKVGAKNKRKKVFHCNLGIK